jgi:P4 family phage/plasmid primase-like protien
MSRPILSDFDTYLNKIEWFLKTHYPDCVLMPTQNNSLSYQGNGKTEGKNPLLKHKDVPTNVLWDKWTEYKHMCAKGLLIILRKDLIVIDVDDKEVASELETQFPIIKTTAIQQTSSGFHYFFQRSPLCEHYKIYDKARCLSKFNPNTEKDETLPIDIKTVCSTGTGGVISIFPSPRKKWIRPLYTYPPIAIPDELVEYIVSHHDDFKRIDDTPSMLAASNITYKSIDAASTYANDLNLAKELVECLSADRVDQYGSWITLGICLKEIHNDLFDTWLAASMKSKKFTNVNDCRDKWESFGNGNGKKLTMGTLKMWAKQDSPELYWKFVRTSLHDAIHKALGATHTDIAHVIHLMYKDEFVCTSIKDNIWWQFDQHRWIFSDAGRGLRIRMSNDVFNEFCRASTHYAHKSINEYDDQLKQTYADKAQRFMNIATNLKNVMMKNMLIKECGEIMFDSALIDKLDSNPNLIGFNNGVYDLKTKCFRAGTPMDYLSMSVGYDYNPDVDIEIRNDLMRFLQSTQKTSDMSEYLIKTLAYMLDGYKFMEYMWFFTGSGRNSKGVLCSLLESTLGAYAYTPNASIFTNTIKGGGPNSEIAKLKGKRCVIASEPDDTEGSCFKVSRLKNWRGNDTLQARGLYKEAIEFKPHFGMIIQMNDMPALDKVDAAFARTLKVVHFPFVFTENPARENERLMDPTLKSKFQDNVAYHQQFMLILIDYYHKYIYVDGERKMLADPVDVKAATANYIEDNNVVGVWLKEFYNITNDAKDRVKAMELYQDFVDDTKNKMISQKQFSKALQFNGIVPRRLPAGMVYVGICRKDISFVDEIDGYECM